MKRMSVVAAAAFAAAVLLCGRLNAAEDDWKVSMQTYSLNSMSFFDAADKSKAMGIKYLEAFPGQKIGGDIEGKMDYKMDAATRDKIVAKLKEKGMTLMNYGVVNAGSEKDWRALFEFAKAMGIKTIVTEAGKAQLPMIDKMCNEFDINIALHNHPKPSPYWNPDTVLDAVKDCSKHIGACADTGHWARSGLDPAECLKKLEGRITSLHFKDLKKGADGKFKDAPWGTGDLNCAKLLAELKRQNFKGVFSIEYESGDRLADCPKCVEFFNKCKDKTEADLNAMSAPEKK